MGIMDKIKGELVDIIEWIDDSRSTLAWRFPRYHNEIKNGAELIVREGQEAVFVYRGALADRFSPGHYALTSENLPILGTLQGWKHGFNSPFRSEVCFINTRPVTDLRWGPPQPVTVRDPDFKMVQIRANGLCVVKIEDAEVFLREVIGTDSNVDIEEITELLRRVITLAFSDLVLETGLGAIDLQGRQVELSAKLRDFVAERVGDETLLAQIVAMVAQAQRSRAPIQGLADKVASFFVPSVLFVAVLTFALWWWLGPEPRLAFAVVHAVASVL